jgi:Uma2 family endonuclease
MATTAPITTAEQLLHAPDLGPCELVRGKLVIGTCASFEAGRIAASLALDLMEFAKPRKLGVALMATGFQIASGPDTVRVPRVAFLRAERIPTENLDDYVQGAPDLAVEILSPWDLFSMVNAKVQDWLDAGCRLVWVVDPETRIVTVYQGRTQAVVLRASDTLTGGDVLPGFSLPVAEVLTS